jgi:two-component system, LuxR family, response regulator DctR
MNKSRIYILDDQQEVVDLAALFLTGLDVDLRKYTNPEKMLADFDGAVDGCLIVDLQMPNLNGIQVLERLRGWLPMFPVLFVTAFADIPLTVSIMQAGAFDLIQKPFSRDDLVKRVMLALAWSKDLRTRQKESIEIWIAIQSLTTREMEILDHLVAGMSSREIGEKLAISRFTVDHHRAHILSKLSVSTLSGLTSAVSRAKTLFEMGNGPVRLGVLPTA